MPYFKIETSREMDPVGVKTLCRDGSRFLSGLLGKPEQVIMTAVVSGMEMLFNGSDAPAAYVEIKSIGLSPEKCPAYAQAVCDFLETAIKVPAERIYIDFADINGKMFGWNRKTF